MQKFNKNDYVIALNFNGDFEEAIILGTWGELYGNGKEDGDKFHDYSVRFKEQGECAWINEDDITLIAAHKSKLLKSWVSIDKRQEKVNSNLGILFSNPKNTIKNYNGAMAQALWSSIGGGNIWGNYGEGFIFQTNSIAIMMLAKPFIINKDLLGWNQYCYETIKGK